MSAPGPEERAERMIDMFMIDYKLTRDQAIGAAIVNNNLNIESYNHEFFKKVEKYLRNINKHKIV